MKKKISALSIDRSKWAVPKNLKTKFDLDCDPALLCEKVKTDRYGDPTGATKNSGMKCCLGFLVSALGFRDREILGVTMPSDLKKCFPNSVPSLYVTGPLDDESPFLKNDFEAQAAALNDSQSIKPEAKERKLKALFSEVGIRLTFRGKYLDEK